MGRSFAIPFAVFVYHPSSSTQASNRSPQRSTAHREQQRQELGRGGERVGGRSVIGGAIAFALVAGIALGFVLPWRYIRLPRSVLNDLVGPGDQ